MFSTPLIKFFPHYPHQLPGPVLLRPPLVSLSITPSLNFPFTHQIPGPVHIGPPLVSLFFTHLTKFSCTHQIPGPVHILEPPLVSITYSSISSSKFLTSYNIQFSRACPYWIVSGFLDLSHPSSSTYFPHLSIYTASRACPYWTVSGFSIHNLHPSASNFSLSPIRSQGPSTDWAKAGFPTFGFPH